MELLGYLFWLLFGKRNHDLPEEKEEKEDV